VYEIILQSEKHSGSEHLWFRAERTGSPSWPRVDRRKHRRLTQVNRLICQEFPPQRDLGLYRPRVDFAWLYQFLPVLPWSKKRLCFDTKDTLYPLQRGSRTQHEPPVELLPLTKFDWEKQPFELYSDPDDYYTLLHSRISAGIFFTLNEMEEQTAFTSFRPIEIGIDERGHCFRVNSAHLINRRQLYQAREG
jgi:hypothetical protein